MLEKDWSPLLLTGEHFDWWCRPTTHVMLLLDHKSQNITCVRKVRPTGQTIHRRFGCRLQLNAEDLLSAAVSLRHRRRKPWDSQLAGVRTGIAH